MGAPALAGSTGTHSPLGPVLAAPCPLSKALTLEGLPFTDLCEGIFYVI
jgi:hypothetical protein